MTISEHEDFGLSTTEFWESPTKTFGEVDDRLSEKRFTGLRIAAPRLVPLGVRETFPLVVYHSATFAERRGAGFVDQGAIVAVDLLSNLTYAREPMLLNPERVRPTRDPPSTPAPQGLTSQIFATELRERLQLPWTRARYAVTALLRNQVSNRLIVDVDRPPSAYRDEEVERFLESERVTRAPKEPWPERGVPYPHYEREPAHPAVPQGIGISLIADRVSVRREGGAIPGSAVGRCEVRGSFRLPVLPHEVLPRSPAKPAADAPAKPAADGIAKPAADGITALVRIGLVILGADEADPFVLQLRVPSHDPIDTAGQPVVTGYFALDLLAMDEMPERAQTYFLYAFSGEEMAGPVPAAIVSEDLLPATPERD